MPASAVDCIRATGPRLIDGGEPIAALASLLERIAMK
jgi:hypothetical protein